MLTVRGRKCLVQFTSNPCVLYYTNLSIYLYLAAHLVIIGISGWPEVVTPWKGGWRYVCYNGRWGDDLLVNSDMLAAWVYICTSIHLMMPFDPNLASSAILNYDFTCLLSFFAAFSNCTRTATSTM